MTWANHVLAVIVKRFCAKPPLHYIDVPKLNRHCQELRQGLAFPPQPFMNQFLSTQKRRFNTLVIWKEIHYVITLVKDALSGYSEASDPVHACAFDYGISSIYHLAHYHAVNLFWMTKRAVSVPPAFVLFKMYDELKRFKTFWFVSVLSAWYYLFIRPIQLKDRFSAVLIFIVHI